MIPFKRPLLLRILEGKKTQTRRSPRYQYTLGKIYDVGDEWKRGPQGRIIITRKYRQRLCDLTQEEIEKEGFDSLEEMRAFWEENIGPWQPGQVVIAYEFQLC